MEKKVLLSLEVTKKKRFYIIDTWLIIVVASFVISGICIRNSISGYITPLPPTHVYRVPQFRWTGVDPHEGNVSLLSSLRLVVP